MKVDDFIEARIFLGGYFDQRVDSIVTYCNTLIYNLFLMFSQGPLVLRSQFLQLNRR